MTMTHETSGSGIGDEIFISADSHVVEPHDLWVKELPSAFRDQAPIFPDRRDGPTLHPGGWDPNERIKEMAVDGISGEVLYPTLGLKLYDMEDANLQDACFQVFNSWLIDYCRVAPDRLVGIAMVSVYDIDNAIREMERSKQAGLRGVMIWQVPPPDLSFRSGHYDRFWAAAQEFDMPVSLHILTGRYPQDPTTMHGLDHYYGAVNLKLQMVGDALFDIIFSGVLERFPRLKIVLVENEVGWIPFMLDQWDRYSARFAKTDPLTLTMKPSEYFARQVYATFFNDPVGGHTLTWWGVNNSMWSSDYPHPNSTWPHSRQTIARDLGRLSAEDRGKIVRDNVAQLYHLTVPSLLTAAGSV